MPAASANHDQPHSQSQSASQQLMTLFAKQLMTTYPNSLAMLDARDMERGLATSYSLSDLYRKDSRRCAPCKMMLIFWCAKCNEKESLAGLGTRQHCRDNVTIFRPYNCACCIMSIFVFFLVPEAVLSLLRS